jgi:hypothetical protein
MCKGVKRHITTNNCIEKLINNIKNKNDCFINNKLNRAINKIGDMNKSILESQFRLADDNTALSVISSNYNNLELFYKMINDLSSKSEYKQKYIKYKTKYITLKKLNKIKINK